MKPGRKWIAGMAIGALVAVTPIFAVVFNVARSFQLLGHSGIGNPDRLTAAISGVLIWSTAGIFLFAIGGIVFTISLILYFNRRAQQVPTGVTDPGYSKGAQL